MKKIFIFMIALLLSQQYLSAQNITTTYSLPGINADAQTQKIMVRPSNPDEQVVLSRDGNTSYFYLIPPDRGMAQCVELDHRFIVYDFDLYGDTIVFCGKYSHPNVDTSAFIGAGTLQTLFSNSPSWMPVLDTNLRYLEKVQLTENSGSIIAACYAAGSARIYHYITSFNTMVCRGFNLNSYLGSNIVDDVDASDVVITDNYIIYTALNENNSSVQLYKIGKNILDTMSRIAIVPNSNGTGGILTKLNKDTIIMAVNDLIGLKSYIYVVDVGGESCNVVSCQRINGYSEKIFPVDILFNSDIRKILYLQHSALNIFQTNRRDIIFELNPFPPGRYRANVIYNSNAPVATYVYNSFDLISANDLIICGKNYDNSGFLTFVEQKISKMPYVHDCLKPESEIIEVLTSPSIKNIKPLNTNVTTVPMTTYQISSIYGNMISLDCQTE